MKSSRRQKVLNHFSGLLLFAFIFVNALSAFAGPGKTTYQAKIVKPDGYPLEEASVNFKFTILDPVGSCVLYSETYSSVNMASTGGLISFALGSGVKTYPASATTFEQVFSNITPSLSCDTGGPANYSPASSDIRKIVMQFHDGSGWQTLPAMSINAVPYAMYANEAAKLNGLTSTDFVQLSTVPTCAASEALRYTGASFSCVALGGGVTSSTVITALGYTPADGASVTTLTSNVSSVSSTVFSVSSTVTSLQNSVAASFAAITSSQWTTSGTNIFYSAGNVGIGITAPTVKLQVVVSATTDTEIASFKNSGSSDGGYISFPRPSDPTRGLIIGHQTQAGNTSYASASTIRASGGLSQNIEVQTGFDGSGNRGSVHLQTYGGNVGIGTTAPVTTLDVSGGVRIGTESTTCAPALAGTLRYNASNVEYCNGTSWQAFGVSGAGITNFNGSTSGTQTFATGTGGTAPNFVTANGVHTLNIPLASTGSVTAGLISNSDYTTFSNKITSSAASIAQVLGYVPADNAVSGTYAQKANNLSDLTNVATARTNLGLGTFATANSIDLGSASATGTLAIARLPSFIGDATIAAASNTIILSNSGVTAGTYTKVTVDAKGRVTSSSALASSDVTTALGYTPASASASTQWTTSGSAIYYNTGDVGIGTTAPTNTLSISGTANITGSLLVGDGTKNSAVARLDAANYAWYGWYLGGVRTAFIQSTAGEYSIYSQTSGVPMTFYTSSTERVRLDANGNLGIGTTAPTSKLHVQDGAAVIKGTGATLTVKKGFGTPNTLSTESVASFDNESGSGVAVNFFTGSAQAANIYMGDTASPQQGAIKYLVHSAVPSSQYMSFSTSSTERLRINSSGNVGVGITAPTAKLHLSAGTSSNAPLKLTSGTLLTSPQSGTIEYDGSNFYITDSTNTRRAIAANANPGTYDNVSNINSSGNITLTPTGSVVVSSTTASTNSSTGSLVVKGGLGVAGDIYTSGTIVTSSNIQGVSVTATSGMISPYIYGSIVSGGALTLNSTTHSTKGNILLAPSGGNVGIGTTSPGGLLSTYMAGNYTIDIDGPAGNWRGLEFKSAGTTIGQMGKVASASDDMYIKGNGTTNLILQHTGGNVGIGTTGPLTKLSVEQGSIYANGVQSDTIFNGTVANATAPNLIGSDGYWAIRTAINNSFNIDVTTPIPLTAMTVLQNGNVGIGTTAPTQKLHLNSGVMRISGGGANGQGEINLDSGTEFDGFQVRKESTTLWGIKSVTAGNDLAVYVDNTDSKGVYIKSGGNVGIGTTTPTQKLEVVGNIATTTMLYSEAGLYDWGSNNTGFAFPANGEVSLQTNGLSRLHVLANGNVGIGITNPSAKLELTSGTATVAPFKFTSGTLLTSPQSGAIEYDGANFYLTDGTNTRRAIAANTNPGTYDNVSNINSSGNITLTPTGSVVVSSTTASTNSSTGSLVVKGGLGVAGDIYTSGTIVTSSNIQGVSVTATSGMISPYIYGSTVSGGALTLDSTTHATKGNILLAPNGGNIGIGTSAPQQKLHLNGAGIFRIQDNDDTSPHGYVEFGVTTAGSWSRKGYIGMPGAGSAELAIAADGAGTPIYFKNTTGAVMTVSGSNVGIGTTTPNANLDVAGQAWFGVTNKFKLQESSDALSLQGTLATDDNQKKSLLLNAWGGSVGVGTTTPADTTGMAGQAPKFTVSGGYTNLNLLRISGSDTGNTIYSAQSALTISTGGGTNQHIILNPNGNVGVGTATPTSKLHLYGGNVNFQLDDGNGIANFQKTSTDLRIATQTALPIWFATNGSERVRVDGAGNVGIGTTNPGSKLEVGGAAIFGGQTVSGANVGSIHISSGQLASDSFTRYGYWNGVINTGIYDVGYAGSTGAFTIRNVSSGSENPATSVYLASSGNLGIGTNSPSAKLDISGTVNSSSHISQGTQQAYPLASWGAATSSSGAIIIKLPGGYSNYGMLNVEIDTYEYNTNGATKYYIGGHNWNGAWYNYTNQTIGNSNKKVRLGYKDGQYVIVIGDNTSTWSYGSVKLTKITNGDYYSSTINLKGTYTITQDASAEVYDWISADLNKSYFGTTNFSGNLNVAGDNYALFGPNSGWGATLRVGGNGGTATAHASIATTNGNLHLDALDAAHNSYINWYRGADFYVGKGDGSTTLFIVKNGGNVGIGTIAPSASLDIAGNPNNAIRTAYLGVSGNNSTMTDRAYIRGLADHLVVAPASNRTGGADSNTMYLAYPGDLAAGDTVNTRIQESIFITSTGTTGGGNVGIATASPSEKLHVVGNLRVQGSTDCTLGNGAGGTNCSSDMRLKENVKPIPYALEKIVSLKGVEFDWNEKTISHGRHDIGVIAQDVEKVFPSAVIDDKNTGYKKVDYAVLVAPLIQAVKELYKFIMDRFEGHDRQIASIVESKADKEQIETLTKKAEKLEAENAALKKYLCSKDPAAPICK